MTIDLNEISPSPLFNGLSNKEIEKIFENLNYQIKSYPVKSTIISQGESSDFLMLLLSGDIQAQMLDFSGKQITIEELSPPMLIAPAFLYAAKNEIPVHVIATKPTSILFIHKTVFAEILQTNQTVLLNFLTIISNRSRFLSEKIMFLNFHLRGKIAAFLLQRYHEQQNTALQIPETQQELADLFGVARPSLARVLKDLKDEGIIDIQKRTFVILHLQALKQAAM